MPDEIRVGIIGLDTSHAKAFTDLWHKKDAPGHLEGVRVVAAYPSFSPDLVDESKKRTEGYSKVLSGAPYNLKMVDSIAELVGQVDALTISSVDGRRHLPELKAIVDAKGGTTKPVFIDKPFSASLADAREMVKIIKETKLPCFSSSALRFESNIAKFVADEEARGKVQGCDAYSPSKLEKTNPGFFWYGIHGVEILFTLMGRGCKSVRCSSSPDNDLAVGVWEDGRIGTMRGIRKGKADYGAFVLCEKVMRQVSPDSSQSIYAGLVGRITKFFQTKQPPMAIDETLEICAFIQGALDSSQNHCCDVKIEL